MNSPQHLIETSRWLRYAREDLQEAEIILLQRSLFPRHSCWLAQQATEKALKAVLVFLQVKFPKTHDLDALLNLIPDSWQVKAENPDLAELTEWAVEARYPGDWPDALHEDANKAVEQSRAVLDSVTRELRKRGVEPESLPPDSSTSEQ